jgi:hypothetical protein
MEFEHKQLTEVDRPDGIGKDVTVHLTGNATKDADSFNFFRLWLEEHPDLKRVAFIGHGPDYLKFTVMSGCCSMPGCVCDGWQDGGAGGNCRNCGHRNALHSC